MTAINDIRAVIDMELRLIEREDGPLTPAAQRYARANRMRVEVGYSAARSIMAELGEDRLPSEIDYVPLLTTEEFNGFQVVVL